MTICTACPRFDTILAFQHESGHRATEQKLITSDFKPDTVFRVCKLVLTDKDGPTAQVPEGCK